MYSMRDEFCAFNTITFNNNAVYRLAKLEDNWFICSSQDKTVKILNIYGDCICVLRGHSSYVYAVLILSNRNIVSSSGDWTIKFWQPSGACLKTVQLGSVIFSFLELRNGTLFCGCYDGSIVSIDRDTYKQKKVFKAHSSCVNAMIQLTNGFIVTGSWNFEIKIWNTAEECMCLTVFHQNPVIALCPLKNGDFGSASDDKTIKIWNIKGECKATFIGHTDAVNAVIELEDGTVASASNDKTIKIWSKDGKCLQTLYGHNSLVYSIVELRNGVLISASEDGVIKIWRKNSLKLLRFVFSDVIFNFV